MSDAAFERRLKKQVHGRPQRALVRFPKGLGEIALAETEALLARPLFPGPERPRVLLEPNAVRIDAIAFRELAALALRATTAREILWEIGVGKRVSAKSKLTQTTNEVPWEFYLAPGTSVSLRVSSTASRLYHETMVKEMAAKVLTSRGFTIGAGGASDVALDVRLHHDELTLALAVSSRPLYHRGYKRVFKGLASVKEDLAAASLQFALRFAREGGGAFDARHVFVPFAGSGTLGFEMSMLLGAQPPALFLPPLAIESMPCMPVATRGFIRRKLADIWVEHGAAALTLRFVELDAGQVEALNANIDSFGGALTRAGGARPKMMATEADALEPGLWPREPAWILLNPPYGDRLDARRPSIYPDLARRLRETVETAPIAGMAYAPDETAAACLTGSSARLEWTSCRISHGGRPTALLAFRSKG